MSEPKTKDASKVDADQSAKQKSAAEAEAKAALLTPLAQIEKRTLATGAGQPCKTCKKPLPCDLVRVEKGQVLKVEGMPFVVGVRADFEMCCRCGNFFLLPAPKNTRLEGLK